MGGLFAAIGTLGEVIKLAREIFTYLREQLKEDPNKFLLEVTEAFGELNQAKTPTDKKNATVKLATLAHKLINGVR